MIGKESTAGWCGVSYYSESCCCLFCLYHRGFPASCYFKNDALSLSLFCFNRFTVTSSVVERPRHESLSSVQESRNITVPKSSERLTLQIYLRALQTADTGDSFHQCQINVSPRRRGTGERNAFTCGVRRTSPRGRAVTMETVVGNESTDRNGEFISEQSCWSSVQENRPARSFRT